MSAAVVMPTVSHAVLLPVAFLLGPRVEWVAERFLNGVPEGIALALLAWVWLRLFVRKSSSTRFAIWLSALLAIVALPLLRGLWTPEATRSGSASFISVSGSWARDLFYGWMALSTLALIRVGMGIWNVHKLRRNCEPVDVAELDPAVQQTLKSSRGPRKVELAISSRVSVPAVIGFFKPVILLPAWALAELSAEQLNTVLMHELAHLRRWDDWTNLGQKLMRAVFFFHPAIWWIDHQLSLEREMACDEFVLSSTRNPRAYAACLVSLAEKSLLRRTVALAQALVGRMGETSRRVTQILNPNHGLVPRRWKPVFALMAIVSASGTLWLMRAPDLVAFRDAASTIPAANASAAVPAALMRQPAESAKMTLAKYIERGAPTVRPRAAVKRRVMRQSEAPVLKAKAEPPRMVQASTRIMPAPLAIETVYVLRAAQVSSANGGASSSWTLCVWRVTLVNGTHSGNQNMINSQTMSVLPPSRT